MRQQQFERTNAETWDTLRLLLREMETSKRKRGQAGAFFSDLPRLYRQTCNHYALAQARRYSPALVAELHDLVIRAHRQLYRERSAWFWNSIVFLGVGFPRSVRENIRYVRLSLVLFIGSALVLGFSCYRDAALIYSVLDEEEVAGIEAMYDPGNRRPGRAPERGSESDFVMFGFYISNNIAIGFRTFAGGVLFGIGTVLLLLFNGVVIGGIAGHLTRLGYQDTFWSFVSGHSALELTAIVICGGAGLMLAHALLAPRQLTRIQSLKQMAPEALKLVIGAAAMLLAAAFVEAFWSSSTVPNAAKYIVASLLWALVLGYLSLAGAKRGS